VRTRLALLLLTLAFLCAGARNHAERRAFIAANPCPATGKPAGPCPGWVIDHVVPLCAGGADHRSNMQWQTVAEAKAKDREERAQCRLKR